ncbi:MAG: AAA family ATPase [Candidatus Cloacimonetes bacterium]|nr:AAA family ATPase [Candidatus Cloacimonadota bacterium]
MPKQPAPQTDKDKSTINSPAESAGRPTSEIAEIALLKNQITKVTLPPELRLRAERMLESLTRMSGTRDYNSTYDETRDYFDWITNLPWDARSKDTLDLDKAQEILDSTHYGLEEIKERILEYMAVLKLQKEAKKEEEREKIGRELSQQGVARSPVLFFVGLPGIGKTSISYTIAKAIGRKFIRIAMGGMGDALQLRGQSRMHPDAESGLIIKGLRRAQVKNPVLLLDEIDRTADAARAQIMGVLLELLDPEQNFAFTDHFIDYPFDLSEVMFICSANNTGGISNAVLDRMEQINMPGYSDDEKIAIARQYLLPRQLAITGMPKEAITFSDAVWPAITRPLGYDAGIRTMERTINSVVRKAAKKLVTGQGKKFEITLENLKEYLPKW